jgi:hypothetical protein
VASDRQAGQAQIKLYSVKGEQLNSFPISQRGAGQLSLDTTTLPAGVYLYRLFIDGKPIDVKKLLLVGKSIPCPKGPIAQELIPELWGLLGRM